MDTIIDVLIKRHDRVRESLNALGEITLMADIDAEFRKVLVLSIGSFFENQITNAISILASCSQSERITSLIKAKAISRQYHTYFDWNGKNPNSFLGLFGTTFKDKISSEIKANPKLGQGCEAFLKLGQKRNVLAHENFANAPIEWTLDEIKQLYEIAFEFVTYLSAQVQSE